VSIVTNRQFLRRALDLGFRSFHITSPEKPILCREGNRVFVWILLDPKTALPPHLGAVRVKLDFLPDNRRQASPLPVSAPSPRAALSIPRRPSRKPARALDGFLFCARSLWNLVRKHHLKERVK